MVSPTVWNLKEFLFCLYEIKEGGNVLDSNKNSTVEQKRGYFNETNFFEAYENYKTLVINRNC